MFQAWTIGIRRIAVALATAAGLALTTAAIAKGPDPAKPETVPQKGTTGKPLTPSLQRALKESPPLDMHAVPPPANPKAAAQQAPTPTVQLKPGEVPKIEFDTPVFDFGRIKAGQDVNHDFWFTNTGNGPLEILQVKPS